MRAGKRGSGTTARSAKKNHSRISWGEPADLSRCRRGTLQQFVGVFVDRSAVHPPRRPPQGKREGNLAVRVEHRGRDGSELVEIVAVERVRVVTLRGGFDEFPVRAWREAGVRFTFATLGPVHIHVDLIY